MRNKCWLREDMCSWHEHMSCSRVVRYRGWVCNTLMMNWLVAVVWKIMHNIARVTVERGKTLRMWVVVQVVRHFGFIGDWSIIVGDRCNISWFG